MRVATQPDLMIHNCTVTTWDPFSHSRSCHAPASPGLLLGIYLPLPPVNSIATPGEGKEKP